MSIRDARAGLEVGEEAIAGIRAKLAPDAASVWDLPPLERGVPVEKGAGVNIGGNYPVIDDLRGGVATSVKSIDLKAPSYQKPGAVESRIKGQVNRLDRFQGVDQSGFDSRGPFMNQKVLDVYVPKNSISPSQASQMSRAASYASSRGITVNYYGIQ